MMTVVRNQNNATQSETTESQNNATQPETKESVECEEVLFYHQAGSVMVYTLSSSFNFDELSNPLHQFSQPGPSLKRLGVEKKIQAKMTLLNYDAERLKTIKKAKEDERKKKDDELENKYKSKQKILDLYISSTGVSIKPIPPEEQKRIDELTTEQIPLRFDSNKLKITVDRINKKKMLYEKLIEDLKKTKTEEVYKKRLYNFEKKI